jgi:hypothetical protein
MHYNGVKMTLKEIKTMTDQKRFTLRMDGELFETIKERAEKNKRSIAKEIEHLLENYIQDEEKDNKEK